MARKATYPTAGDLEKAVDKYIAECVADDDVFPDLAGMLLRLGISKRTMQRQVAEKPEYAEVWEKAKLSRESWLVRHMTKDNKLANGCMNALKQEQNGGYVDKPQENGEKKLVIELRKNIEASDFK